MGCWWLLLRGGRFPLLPLPIDVWRALLEGLSSGQLVRDAIASVTRVAVGFTIAAVLAALLVTAGVAVRGVREPIRVLLEFLRPIPPIAWIPLAVMLVGLGNPTALFVIVVGAFFPLYTNAVSAIDSIPRVFMEVASMLGAGKVEIVRRVAVPGALPGVFAGLRIGMGFAWMCVVAAEMTATDSGLGYSIQLNRQALRLENVVAGMIVIGVIGWLTTFGLGRLERQLIPWRFRESGAALRQRTANGTNQPADERDTKAGVADGGQAVSVSALSFGYEGAASVLRNITFSVMRGEIVVLMGPSGSGKTTLLRLIAGLEKASEGSVRRAETSLRADRYLVSLVFQSAAAFPWMTAEENVQFALDQRGASLDGKRGEASPRQFLDEVGLSEFARRYPHALSGGQQQRVALARSLASGSELLLMDEPFSALDGPTREALQEMVFDQIKLNAITSVIVTHDVNEAVFIADRILVLGGQPATMRGELRITAPHRRDTDFRESELSLANRRELRRMLDHTT